MTVTSYDRLPLILVEMDKYVRQCEREGRLKSCDVAQVRSLRDKYLKLKDRMLHTDINGQRTPETPESRTASLMTVGMLFKIMKELG